MNYTQEIRQKSSEWFILRAAKISGTRFGQVISGKKNDLLYKLINEKIKGTSDDDEEAYIDDAMQYGLDNEEHAIDLYEIKSGIKFKRGGVIYSDYSKNHIHSPDAVNLESGIVVEVKCTMEREKQIKRFFDGAESSYLPQIINAFACSDSIKEVHWISYSGFCKQLGNVVMNKEIISIIYKRENYLAEILKGRNLIKEIEIKVDDMYNKFVVGNVDEF